MLLLTLSYFHLLSICSIRLLLLFKGAIVAAGVRIKTWSIEENTLQFDWSSSTTTTSMIIVSLNCLHFLIIVVIRLLSNSMVAPNWQRILIHIKFGFRSVSHYVSRLHRDHVHLEQITDTKCRNLSQTIA